MNKPSVALAMIVKGSKEEALPFARCLAHTSPFVDGLFITITHGKGEVPNEEVVKIAESYKATISYFEWINDFGKARNFNFSQVPEEYDYILWCDADDIFEGLEFMKKTLSDNPHTDVFSFWYHYSFDESGKPNVVHQKAQLVRNDGCVEWKGKLHEDLMNTRAVDIKLVEDITRIHLTDDKRIEIASQRNLEIARDDVQENPEDPRSYWNLGNSQKGVGKNKEAIETFNKFIEMSNSDDEKYIAYIRIAESNWALGKYDEAIKAGRYAVGMKPEYPDAYTMLGHFFSFKSNFTESVKMYRMALELKPPYTDMIVYNPRDYDFAPLMGLVNSYFSLGFPQLALPALEGCCKIYPQDKKLKRMYKMLKKKADEVDRIMKKAKEIENIEDDEELKKELDSLPQEFQEHPFITKIRNERFIKTESSGKDVVIFCGYTTREWNAKAVDEGIGGSEEAVINLSKRLVKRGWNVTVYNNCGLNGGVFDGVLYRPYYSWNTRDKNDIVILWRNAKLVDHEINTKKLYIDVHDVMPEGEFSPKRLKKIDKIFVKSKVHRSLYPDVPDNKFIIVPNGIDEKVFEQDLIRDNNLIINTSSPDRSLSVAVELFGRIKKLHPEAKMAWAYGWQVFDDTHRDNAKIMSWKNDVVKKMEDNGVINLGRISHKDVAMLYLTANVLGYPSEFFEIDMISLTKAMAGGAIPVTTDFAAMGEKAKFGHFIHSEKNNDNWCKNDQFDFSMVDSKMKDEYVEKVVELLKNPPSERDRREMREWARSNYSWDSVVDVWEEEMNNA